MRNPRPGSRGCRNLGAPICGFMGAGGGGEGEGAQISPHEALNKALFRAFWGSLPLPSPPLPPPLNPEMSAEPSAPWDRRDERNQKQRRRRS